MLDRQVDGLVYATLVTLEIDPAEASARRHRSCSSTASCPEDDTFRSVVPDEFGGGRTAARLLIDAGYGDLIEVIGVDPNPRALAGPARLRGITAELAGMASPSPR